jgi:hypothetical protein
MIISLIYVLLQTALLFSDHPHKCVNFYADANFDDGRSQRDVIVERLSLQTVLHAIE